MRARIALDQPPAGLIEQAPAGQPSRSGWKRRPLSSILRLLPAASPTKDILMDLKQILFHHMNDTLDALATGVHDDADHKTAVNAG